MEEEKNHIQEEPFDDEEQVDIGDSISGEDMNEDSIEGSEDSFNEDTETSAEDAQEDLNEDSIEGSEDSFNEDTETFAEEGQETLDEDSIEGSEDSFNEDTETFAEEGQETLDEDSEGVSEDSFSEESMEEGMSDELDEQSHKKSIVEGALFVAGRPISIEEIHIKSDLGKVEIKNLVEELAMDYLMRPTCLEIVQIQDKYSLQIKPEYTPKLKKFATGGLIPDAILKTLTIIALKQPIMKSMLVKLRGSTAYEHVKYLNENGYLILIKKGRSSELSTSDQFADTFGLSRDKTELKKQMITQLGIKEKSDS